MPKVNHCYKNFDCLIFIVNQHSLTLLYTIAFYKTEKILSIKSLKPNIKPKSSIFLINPFLSLILGYNC